MTTTSDTSGDHNQDSSNTHHSEESKRPDSFSEIEKTIVEDKCAFSSAKEGDKLGSGKIVGILGEGGMGRVYKIWCEDLELFRAVKVILNNTEAAVKRFVREAKLTARLDHTNIVRVFSTGIWNDCRYIEMEYIEGRSFDVLLRKYGRFNTGICLAIGIIVARVLAYAHNHQYTLDGVVCTGLVHRDLKPSNLMLTNDGRLKVLDFGIARPIADTVATLTTGVIGSLHYLPPEQLDGGAVDSRADIYALGVMLYELAGGQVAFPFSNYREFYNNKTHGAYTPLIKIRPDIPVSFSKIVDRCLKVNPQNRYQNAAELLAALQKVASNEKTFNSAYDEFTDHICLDQNDTVSQQRKIKKISPAIIKTGSVKRSVVKTFIPVIGTIIAIGAIVSRHYFNQLFPHEKQLEIPVIVSPEKDAVFQDKRITLIWNRTKKADHYEVDLSTDKNFSDSTRVYSNLTDTFLLTEVKHDGKFYWRLCSCFGNGRGSWSETRSFLNRSAVKSFSIEEKKISRTELLTTRYHSTRMTYIFMRAIQKNNLSDAEEAFRNISKTDTGFQDAALRLADAYLNAGKPDKAKRTLTGIKCNDALFYICTGRILYMERTYNDALNAFKIAQENSSAVFRYPQIIHDASYYYAQAAQGLFLSNPTAENRDLALKAWEIIITKLYVNDKSNPRFKNAIKASNQIVQATSNKCSLRAIN